MLEQGELRQAAETIRGDFSGLDVDETGSRLLAAPGEILEWRSKRPRWQLYHRPRTGGRMVLLVRGVDLEEDSVQGNLARIRDLVQAERLAEARELVALLAVEGPVHPGLQKWQEVLAPPKGTAGGPRDVDRAADYACLEQESARHQGKWVAVADGALVASSAAYEDLLTQLQEHQTAVPPFVTFVPHSNADAR